MRRHTRDRRWLLAAAPLLVALAAACDAGPGARRPAGDAPSILLVTIDTLRADHVGCYGSAEALTPEIDRLATEGVRFAEARAHVPLTLPSHATMFTGRLPPRHGVRGNGLFELPPEVPHVAESLRDAGYSTAAVVASVVLDRAHGLDRGFDVYDDNQRVGDRAAFDYLERGASQIAEAAAGELQSLEPPFFLWVHLYDPHLPWVAPAPFAARHPGRPYDAEISFADRALGEIRRAAARRAGEAGLYVAVTSDHGESLGQHGENQHGYTLHRGVLRVPLVLAGPGVPPGRVVEETAGLVDLAPTLARWAGAAPPAGGDGRPLQRLFHGEPAGAGAAGLPLWEESLHPLYDSGWAPLRGLLTEDWHLVEAPRPELYDRRGDPDDRIDLAARRPRVVARLRAELQRWGDRLGDVPEPAPQEPGGDEAERRERLDRLASLGYLSAGDASGRMAAGERLDPKDGLPGFLAIEAADGLLDEGRGAEAQQVLAPHLERDPRNPRLWHQSARALLAAGRLEQAERAIRRASELAPRVTFIRSTLAAVLEARGDGAGARAELERIVADHPRAADATLQLAALTVAAGEAAAASAILERSLAAGVRDPDVLLRLGLLRKAAGHDADAERRFREALELRPADPTALLELGRAALRGSRPHEALEPLSGCLAGARALECHVELARALVVGPRDLGRAREVLLAARRLAGEDGVARREVERRLEALDGMHPQP